MINNRMTNFDKQQPSKSISQTTANQLNSNQKSPELISITENQEFKGQIEIGGRNFFEFILWRVF